MMSGKQQDKIGTAFNLGCCTSTAGFLKQENHQCKMNSKCNVHAICFKYVLCDSFGGRALAQSQYDQVPLTF
jgi:hypothetical protein